MKKQPPIKTNFEIKIHRKERMNHAKGWAKDVEEAIYLFNKIHKQATNFIKMELIFQGELIKKI